jgi:peroxiredoxin
MEHFKFFLALFLLLAQITIRTAFAADPSMVDMKVVPSGIAQFGFSPQELKLSAAKPAGLTKTPALAAPLYGAMNFGGRSFLVVLDDPGDRDPRLYVDANGNDDLTDDPEVSWKKSTERAQCGLFDYQGTMTLPLPTLPTPTPVQLGVYGFVDDGPHPHLDPTLLYYCDYAIEGTIKLNDHGYHARLVDSRASGDFSINDDGAVLLFIDINGNRQFDRHEEIFSSAERFNIAGTTWQLSGMTKGGAFKVVKSLHAVDEIPIPPDLSAGQPAVAFTAKTLDGKEVRFPGDYKGKLVILDFWATWCGPCMEEVPGLVRAYGNYHTKGVDMLSVSLDRPDSADKLKTAVQTNGMTWPQIHDVRGEHSRVALMYGIHSIPHPFLIDGDTGRIIAEGNLLRGDELDKTLASAIADRARK